VRFFTDALTFIMDELSAPQPPKGGVWKSYLLILFDIQKCYYQLPAHIPPLGG
jgi:hypothetical protein